VFSIGLRGALRQECRHRRFQPALDWPRKHWLESV